jgi:hypothetical protein
VPESVLETPPVQVTPLTSHLNETAARDIALETRKRAA